MELNATSPYYAIWLYLARARAGQDGRTELAVNVERLKFVGITEQIVSLFLEKTTPDALFLAAKSSDPKKQKENLCEAQCYLGQHNLLRGNNSEARKLFSTAQAELKRAKRILAPNLPIDDLNAKLSLNDGVLKFDPVVFGAANGRFEIYSTFDGPIIREKIPPVVAKHHCSP